MKSQRDLIFNISDVGIPEMLTDIEYRIAIIGMHQLVPLGLQH